MDFTDEQTYIGTKKAHFKILFEKDAGENLELFLNYISDLTNRQLNAELAELNNNFNELKDSGFFDSRS